MVIRSTVWWPRVICKISRMELRKLQRLACPDITGAMKMAPTAEIEVLPLLHVMIIVKTHAGIYRLMCSRSRNLNTKI
jgi:hypothetical protein